MRQPADIEQNSDGGISDFRVSAQPFVKVNCHNSRTSDDIDMKLRPVFKLDKGNKTTSKNFGKTSCQKIVTSLLFFQFMANLDTIWEPDSGRIVCKTYIFINTNLLFYRT